MNITAPDQRSGENNENPQPPIPQSQQPQSNNTIQTNNISNKQDEEKNKNQEINKFDQKPEIVNEQKSQSKKQVNQSQYESQEQQDSEQSPIQIAISTFTQYFRFHRPVIFVCFNKLKDDIQFRYDKLFEKLKEFLMRQKRPYRMFITIQNFQIDFTEFVDSFEIMDLPTGAFLIFQSNFNDKGGIQIQKYKNSFILKANMKKDSQYQNGYCRFGALEVYQILFSPKILQKQENIVFDNNKQLIRAARWKGYRTFYLSDETFLDALIEWTNLFSLQDLVFKSQDLTPLSNKIFLEKTKEIGKNFESKWKIKDTMGRHWIAIADIVGYMIEPEEINFSSQLIKVINNMYRSMFLKTLCVQVAMIEPSINYKFPKQDKQKKLLHYLIQQSPQYIPLLTTGVKLQQILKNGTILINGVQNDVEGLGGIVIVSSLFFMNQQLQKIYQSIYLKRNLQVDNCMQAYIKDLRVVFNALKQINVKSQYFFDLEGKRKFSVLDVNGLNFLHMHPRIKIQITDKLNFFKNYIELRQYTKIFEFVEDKQLKFFQINRKAVYHNLAKRINNLLQCYQGLEILPEKDILHQIDIILEPHMSYSQLQQKIMDQGRMIICSQFPTDINLLLYYLFKTMGSKFKYTKTIDFAGYQHEKVKKKMADCKKSVDEIIFIKNYHMQTFQHQIQIYNLILNSKGQRSFLVVGCIKKFLPLKQVESLAGKQIQFPIVQIKSSKLSNQVVQPRFSDEKLQVIEEIFTKFIPNHKDVLMQLVIKQPQFKSFLKVPSMLHNIIQLSKSISKKNKININLLFKVLCQHWQHYINDQQGKTFVNKIQQELELLTAQYFTISKTPNLFEDGGLYKKCFEMNQKQSKLNQKKSLQFQTLSFLTFQNNTITFKHQMYAAYFACQFIIKQIQNYNSQLEYVRHFIANPMVRLFLVEKLITMNLRQRLFDMVKKSKYRAIIQNNLTNCGIAASLLALLEPDLSGHDFAFCEFPNASLQGCNLNKTDFSYANMLNCYFGRSNCYETLIFRCKHIGSIQFQQSIQHQSIKQIKQLIIKQKQAYVIVDGFLQIWEYPFNKIISSWKQILLKKIYLTEKYLIGYTPHNIVQIYNLQDMSLLAEYKSNLLIIHDIIINNDRAIMTSNTNCMEQWNYRPYLQFIQKSHTQSQNEKVMARFNKLFYTLKRVCCIICGQDPYFYIGVTEGVIYKYSIDTLNIISDIKLSKDSEVLCLGFYKGKRANKLISFSDDLLLKLFHVGDTQFQLIWQFKQFEILKQINANQDYVYVLSGHAISVYGQKYLGKPVSKLNYYREDGLNFSSTFEDKSSNKLLISHMKGVLTIPFNSNDIFRDTIQHQYSITSLVHTKMPMMVGDSSVEIDVIISGGLDMKILFWQMDTLQIIASINLDCSVHQIKVFDNFLYVASPYFYVLIYSLQTFELVKKLSEAHQGSINCMIMFEQILYVGCGDKNIVKYRAGDWSYRSKISLMYAPTIIVCGIDYFQCIVGTQYGKILWIDDKNYCKHELSQHKTAVESIILDETFGYSCSSELLLKWGIKSRQILTQIIIPASTFTSIQFYKQHIMASINNSIMFLNIDLKELKCYPVHSSKIRCIIYCETNQKLFSAGDDRCIKKFDISKEYEKLLFEMSMPKRLALNNVKFT